MPIRPARVWLKAITPRPRKWLWLHMKTSSRAARHASNSAVSSRRTIASTRAERDPAACRMIAGVIHSRSIACHPHLILSQSFRGTYRTQRIHRRLPRRQSDAANRAGRRAGTGCRAFSAAQSRWNGEAPGRPLDGNLLCLLSRPRSQGSLSGQSAHSTACIHGHNRRASRLAKRSLWERLHLLRCPLGI